MLAVGSSIQSSSGDRKPSHTREGKESNIEMLVVGVPAASTHAGKWAGEAHVFERSALGMWEVLDLLALLVHRGIERVRGTRFTCCTSTTVQILTQKWQASKILFAPALPDGSGTYPAVGCITDYPADYSTASTASAPNRRAPWCANSGVSTGVFTGG